MDRGRDAGGAQRERFRKFVHRQPRDTAVERARDVNEAVAVGVRLDHRHDAGRRHERRQRVDVARDRAEVDAHFRDHRTRISREAVKASGIPKKIRNATMSRSNV